MIYATGSINPCNFTSFDRRTQMQTKQEKRIQADRLTVARALRTPTAQLKLLDNRPGAAKKERARLNAILAIKEKKA